MSVSTCTPMSASAATPPFPKSWDCKWDMLWSTLEPMTTDIGAQLRIKASSQVSTPTYTPNTSPRGLLVKTALEILQMDHRQRGQLEDADSERDFAAHAGNDAELAAKLLLAPFQRSKLHERAVAVPPPDTSADTEADSTIDCSPSELAEAAKRPSPSQKRVAAGTADSPKKRPHLVDPVRSMEAAADFGADHVAGATEGGGGLLTAVESADEADRSFQAESAGRLEAYYRSPITGFVGDLRRRKSQELSLLESTIQSYCDSLKRASLQALPATDPGEWDIPVAAHFDSDLPTILTDEGVWDIPAALHAKLAAPMEDNGEWDFSQLHLRPELQVELDLTPQKGCMTIGAQREPDDPSFMASPFCPAALAPTKAAAWTPRHVADPDAIAREYLSAQSMLALDPALGAVVEPAVSGAPLLAASAVHAKLSTVPHRAKLPRALGTLPYRIALALPLESPWCHARLQGGGEDRGQAVWSTPSSLRRTWPCSASALDLPEGWRQYTTDSGRRYVRPSSQPRPPKHPVTSRHRCTLVRSTLAHTGPARWLQSCAVRCVPQTRRASCADTITTGRPACRTGTSLHLTDSSQPPWVRRQDRMHRMGSEVMMRRGTMRKQRVRRRDGMVHCMQVRPHRTLVTTGWT